jgi:chemotaxis protein methyltransferase CheR
MMKGTSDAQLERLSNAVARHIGLHFPKERWLDLQRAVGAAARECGWQLDLDRYVQALLSPASTQKLDGLASHLTVGETYFFREKRSLEVFEKDLVPELVRRRANRVIRVWSAGCATGEEPYSIAIILHKLMAALEGWEGKILATDLNPKSLQKAREGIYGEWSFRGVPPWVRCAYFETVAKDRWAIRPVIKQMVSFAELNLMADSFPLLSDTSLSNLLPAGPLPSGPSFSNTSGGFDMIFCRNVLMYFTPEGMRKVIGKLHRSLASDGWLIVSPTETSPDLFRQFATVSFGDVTLYRKSTAHPRKTMTLSAAVYEEDRSWPPLSEEGLENAEPVSAPIRPLPTMALPTVAPVCNPGQKSQDQRVHSEIEGSGCEGARQVIGPLVSQDDNDNDAQALLLRARDFANQGKLDTALAWCDKAIAADKMAARAYYLRATILQEQGYLPEAVFALKQTVYAEPQFVLGHFSLGNLALSHGERKESEKYFENVLLLLAQYGPEDIVPESEGLSAGRLREMIVSRRNCEAPIGGGKDQKRKLLQHRSRRTGKFLTESRSR